MVREEVGIAIYEETFVNIYSNWFIECAGLSGVQAAGIEHNIYS